MVEEQKYIAVDLGAESGRVMLGSVWRGRLGLESYRQDACNREQGQDALATKFDLEEIHRFSNGPFQENNTLRWNFHKLLSEIKIGIGKAVKSANEVILKKNLNDKIKINHGDGINYPIQNFDVVIISSCA